MQAQDNCRVNRIEHLVATGVYPVRAVNALDLKIIISALSEIGKSNTMAGHQRRIRDAHAIRSCQAVVHNGIGDLVGRPSNCRRIGPRRILNIADNRLLSSRRKVFKRAPRPRGSRVSKEIYVVRDPRFTPAGVFAFRVKSRIA